MFTGMFTNRALRHASCTRVRKHVRKDVRKYVRKHVREHVRSRITSQAVWPSKGIRYKIIFEYIKIIDYSFYNF